MATIDVQLRPEWITRVGYRYDVILAGEVIVSRSRDPEHDGARALQARGLAGKVRTIDFVTGRPRMILAIEKAARLRVVERDDGGIAVMGYRPMSDAVRAHFGTHTSRRGSAVARDGAQSTSHPVKAAGGETCAAPQRVPEAA
jgi:hypothetical protein